MIRSCWPHWTSGWWSRRYAVGLHRSGGNYTVAACRGDERLGARRTNGTLASEWHVVWLANVRLPRNGTVAPSRATSFSVSFVSFLPDLSANYSSCGFCRDSNRTEQPHAENTLCPAIVPLHMLNRCSNRMAPILFVLPLPLPLPLPASIGRDLHAFGPSANQPRAGWSAVQC